MPMHLESTDAVAALAELVAAGYTADFRIRDGGLINVTTEEAVDPDRVTVDAKFRFETDPGSGDASNIYALKTDGGATRGFLVDALELEGEGAPRGLHGGLESAPTVIRAEGTEGDDYRYGVRKVRKAEFDADPERYVLRLGFPDFPDCPFGQGFTMLGFDLARQEYVWLVTRIIKDDRLKRVPYQGEDSDA